MQSQILNKYTNQIRPSMFLNNLDLNAVILTPKLNPIEFDKSTLINQIKLHKKRDAAQLPVILQNSEILISNKESLENTPRIDSVSQLLSMKASLQQDEYKKLPLIQNTYLQNEMKHKKNVTEGDIQKKKVDFRSSILVIDFINQVMKKDKIDGSAKPLIRKGLQRQQTKFLPKLG